MRINKYLAKCGIASRRKAEELILAGKITVNDKLVKELGTVIKEGDIVKYNNKIVEILDDYEYILVNKPVGYVSTVKDPFAEKTVLDLVKTNRRIYPVGRLDKDSRGLILLTNDGNITYRLTHPSYSFKKTYIVVINGNPTEEKVETLRNGVIIDGYKTSKCQVEKLGNKKYKVVISEGRNRQIRKMFETIGFKVLDLKRVKIGEISIEGIKEGSSRLLTKDEIEYLRSI